MTKMQHDGILLNVLQTLLLLSAMAIASTEVEAASNPPDVVPRLIAQGGHVGIGMARHDIGYRPGETQVVTFVDGSGPRVWDRDTGRLLEILPLGDCDALTAQIWRPPGSVESFFASCAGFLHQIDMDSNATLKRWPFEPKWEQSGLLEANAEKETAVVGAPGALFVWDLAANKEVGPLFPGADLPEGEWYFGTYEAKTAGRIATLTSKGAVTVREMDSGQIVSRWDAGDNTLTPLIFDPAGRWAAVGTREGVVRIVDADTGTEARVLTPEPVSAPPDILEVFQVAWTLIFIPEFLEEVFERMGEGQIGVIEALTNHIETAFEVADGQHALAWPLTVSGSGRLLAVATFEGRVNVYEVESGDVVASVALGSAPAAATFSESEERILLASRDGSWVEVMIGSGEKVNASGAETSVSYAVFSTDGKTLQTAGRPPRGGNLVNVHLLGKDTDGAHAWDLRSARVTALAGPDEYVLGIAGDGQTTALLNRQTMRPILRQQNNEKAFGEAVDVPWTLVQDRVLQAEKKHWDQHELPSAMLASQWYRNLDVEFTPAWGERPAVDLRGWPIKGRQEHRAERGQTNTVRNQRNSLVVLERSEADPLVVSWIRPEDGGRSSDLVGLDEFIGVWDGSRQVGKWPIEPMMSMRWIDLSPDGSVVAVCGGFVGPHGDQQGGRLMLLDLESTTARTLDFDASIDSCLYESGGDTMLVATPGRVARWRPETGEILNETVVENRLMPALSRSPDGRHLMLSSRDTGMTLLAAESLEILGRLFTFQDGSWAVVDPVGRFDAANGGNIAGLHWVVDDEPIALDQLKDRYYEPGLLAKLVGLDPSPRRAVNALDALPLYPSVEMLGQPGEDGTVRVRLEDRGGGIGPVVVSLNGREVLADARPATEGARGEADGVMELTVDLAGSPLLRPGGDNTVEIRAYNGDGWLVSRGIRVGLPAAIGGAETEPPRLFGLFVGVSDYRGEEIDLRYAGRDAVDLGLAVGVAGEGLFAKENVHVDVLSTDLTAAEQQPTRGQILAALDKLAGETRRDDTVFLFLAGHGVTHLAGEGDDYFFLTADAATTRLDDAAVRSSTTISGSELTEHLKAIPAQKQVLVLDTCAAGRLSENMARWGLSSTTQRRAIERMKDRVGTFVLAGTAADAASFESPRYGHGLLTASLLNGLHGEALMDDLYVDVARWFRVARDHAEQIARQESRSQVPRIAAPHESDSFSIGAIPPGERARLPSVETRPSLVRPVAFDAQQYRDGLDLEPAIRERLRELEAEAAIGFGMLDVAEHPDAWRLVVTYKIRGDKVAAKVNLVAPGKTSPQRFTVDGRPDDVAGLADALLREVDGRISTE